MRGVWGETLSARDGYAVGRSFATVVRRAGGSCVAVGRDGRISSPALEQAVVQGLCDGGIAVRRIGLCPTPLMYYAVASAEQVHGGIEITGSHNPKDHNGFKMDLGGQPFFGQDIVELGRIAATGDWMGPAAADFTGVGSVCQVDLVDVDLVDVDLADVDLAEVDLAKAYIARILKALDGIDRAAIARMRIGWDTGNGAAGPLVERLVGHLPGTHVLFHTAVDGHFPHHHPDPSIPENLRDLIGAVAAGKIDFGFAFDGDGDRLGLVDGRGRIVWGDQILLILAQDLLKRRPGARIMADVKTSQVVFDAITALGGTPLMAPTGHSLIKSGMKRTGALLAGEMTGHLFFADDFFGHDDALYGALRVLAASVRLGASITALRDAMPETHATPELRFAVPGRDPRAVVDAVLGQLCSEGVAFDATDGARVTLPYGWWLLRVSNTETVLTARVESLTAAGLSRSRADLAARLGKAGVVWA